jgi:serine/threonine protein kinase
MEFADGGSLARYLENNRNRVMSKVEILNILIDVAMGVQQAHVNDICHNDIKVLSHVLTLYKA